MMNLRTLLLLAAASFLPFSPLCAQQEEPAQGEESAQPLPASHREAALLLIDLLRQTDACLASCTDAAGVQAAIPKLRLLAESVRAFKHIQDSLPEPTTQDYMAVQDLTGDFNTVWDSIRSHIRRLESSNLLTNELRDVLVITSPPHPLPDSP